VENQMRLNTRVVVLSLLVSGIAPLRAQIAVPDVPDVTRDSAAVVTDNIQRASDISSTATLQRPGSALGAPMTGLRAGVHAPESSRPDRPTMMAPEHANLGQARAMMVVGVAALIAGAIIGDTPGTIVMVGGAVIGLIGLYDYLQ
jgi:hypothetical protein